MQQIPYDRNPANPAYAKFDQSQQPYQPVTTYPDQSYQTYQQPHLNSSYHQPPAFKSIMSDPIFRLELQIRCNRTTIIVFSLMTFGMLGLAISFLVFVGLISAIVIIALIPHFVLAIFAYNKVKKPIREQLMGDNSISCSMVTLIIMTLMPF